MKTVFVIMRGEDNEGGSVESVFATHTRAIQHVMAAIIPRSHSPAGWEVVEHLEGRPCTECGNLTPPKPLPCRWEYGIDWIEIQAWPVNP